LILIESGHRDISANPQPDNPGRANNSNCGGKKRYREDDCQREQQPQDCVVLKTNDQETEKQTARTINSVITTLARMAPTKKPSSLLNSD
jgi:hypothetical protein